MHRKLESVVAHCTHPPAILAAQRMADDSEEWPDDDYDDDPAYYYDGYLKKRVEAAVFPWSRLKIIALDKYYLELQTRVNCFSRLAGFDKEFAAM